MASSFDRFCSLEVKDAGYDGVEMDLPFDVKKRAVISIH
jgi:hypothetical protein